MTPWQPPADERFGRITRATSPDDLADATRDPLFDFAPPTDRRPFFFNLLKPVAATTRFSEVNYRSQGVISGNIHATRTLLALAGIGRCSSR